MRDPQVCFGDICYFVSWFESNILNLNLGDSATEIYQTLHKMDQDELAFIFYQLDRYETQNRY